MRIRRALAVGALTAFAVGLSTTAASATYPAPEGSLACSVSQIEPNSTFSCDVYAEDGAQAQLQVTTSGADATIAGTVTSAAKVVTDGSASFDVTVPEDAGTVGITAIVDGVAVDTSTVVVAEDPGTPGGDDAAGPGDGAAAGDDGLAATGFENTGLAIGAGALLILGAGAVVLTARRRATQDM